MRHHKKNIIELTRISTSDYRDIKKLPVVVVADNVRSMMNIGSMLRTADAFRMEEMVLCGISGTPPHPEITKTALGAENSVKWRYEEDTKECVERLRKEGYKICVLEQTHDSVLLQDFIPTEGKKYALVVGNEVDGVDQQVASMADVVIEIPQEGVKHSLNVSISAALAMWQFYSHLA